MESFSGTLKAEEAKREYRDLAEARLENFSYIETFYNRKRIHSSIGIWQSDWGRCGILFLDLRGNHTGTVAEWVYAEHEIC